MIRLQWTEFIRDKRNKPFTFMINIAGLILAFAAIIVMFLYAYGELHHDRDVELKQHIVRVENFSAGLLPGAYGPWLADTWPEVKTFCRVYAEQMKIHFPAQDGGTEMYVQEEVVFADSTYPDLFSLHILKGKMQQDFFAAGQVLLSTSFARKYFGETEPIGKRLIIGENLQVSVMAVFEDVQTPGVWSPSIIVDIEGINKLWGGKETEEWRRANFETYLLLYPNTDREKLEMKFRQHYALQLEQWGYTKDQILESTSSAVIRNFESLYFDSEALGYGRHGNRSDLRILMLIAVLVVGVSIINYVNIATARIVEKSRLIGTKRTLGASRKLLIGEIIGDALLTCFGAMVLAGGIVQLVIPYLKQWLEIEIVSPDLTAGIILWGALPLLCGLLSGIFPAFYLTRLNRMDVINRQRNESAGLRHIKGSLMILQFTVSIGLIIATLFIYQQISYMKHLDPGYSRDNIVVVHGHGSRMLYDRYENFRNILLQNPGILEVGASKNPIYNIRESGFHLDIQGWEKGAVNVLWIDEHFFDLMGLKIVEGRGFGEEDNVKGQRITPKYILNQQLASEIAAVNPALDRIEKERIGIVQNFNFKSMHQPIGPMYFGLLGGYNCVADVYIRIQPEKQEEMLDYIKKVYQQLYSGAFYRYSFMQDDYQQLYGSEEVFLKRLLMFTLFAVIIACLGLLAFVTFAIEQQMKSISIRKVMGASEMQVMILLNRNFVYRLLIGFGIASPLVYYIIQLWLYNFAYRIKLSGWIFGLSFMCMLAIAFFTVSLLTWKTAVSNPVNSLRKE